MSSAAIERNDGAGLVIGALLAIFLPPIGFVVALVMLIARRHEPGTRAWWGLIYLVSLVFNLLILLLWA